MEYIYSALLLHSAGKEINEENIKKVLTAAGVKPDEGRVKALTASLEGVNIADVLKNAAVATTTVAAPASAAPAEAKKEEKKEEKKKPEVSEEEAAAGLSALFD